MQTIPKAKKTASLDNVQELFLKYLLFLVTIKESMPYSSKSGHFVK